MPQYFPGATLGGLLIERKELIIVDYCWNNNTKFRGEERKSLSWLYLLIGKNWLLRNGRSEAQRDRQKAPLVARLDFSLFYWVTNGFIRGESPVYRVVHPNDAFDGPTGQARRDWLNVLCSEMASETKSGIVSIYAEEFIAIVSFDYSVETIETSTWWTIENGKRHRDWFHFVGKKRKDRIILSVIVKLPLADDTPFYYSQRYASVYIMSLHGYITYYICTLK